MASQNVFAKTCLNLYNLCIGAIQIHIWVVLDMCVCVCEGCLGALMLIMRYCIVYTHWSNNT
jgi:hypothetical protein